MWRSVLAALAVYGYGHPSLEGIRPELLNHPLQAFYEQVNQVAADGRHALTSLDPSSSMRYLKGYIERMETQLRDAKSS
jgi:hypothetical protein